MRGANPHRRWSVIGWSLVAFAAILHLYVATSIAGQAIAKRKGEEPERAQVLRLFNDGMHRLGPGADFFALHHAAVALEGDRRIYAWGGDDITPPYYVYRYLPSFAQSAGPIVRLVDPWTAYLGWLVLLEAALLGCIFLTRSFFRDIAPELVPWLIALWLLFTPLWLELQMGQFSFITGALLFFCAWLAISSRPGLALAPWIASVGVKIYPAILLPLWWRRRWLLPAAALLGMLAVANLPGFLQLPGAWRTFSGANLSMPKGLSLDAGNFGLAYVLHLTGVRGLSIPNQYWPIFHRMLGLATLGLAALLVARRRDPPVLLSIALLLLAHQISYKHVWEHHYSLILPMGLLLLWHERQSGRGGWLVLALLVALALPSPFIFWDRPGGDPGRGWPFLVQFLVPASKALPTLGLFAIAVRAMLLHQKMETASGADQDLIVGKEETRYASDAAAVVDVSAEDATRAGRLGI